MLEWLKTLLDTSDFPKRWNCGDWSQPLGWTHIIADLATFGAYVLIPFIMMFFIKRKGMAFPILFYLFAAFIFSCGIVHLIEATIFWKPWYRLSGLFKVATAIVSWATVIAMIPNFPQLLTLRKPSDLIQAEERFRNRLESAPDAMLIINSQGLISLVNKQVEQLFGYTREELVGKSVSLLIPTVEEKDFSEEFIERDEFLGKRKNDQNFPTEISLNPIEIANQTSFCCAIRDVSEKKNAQQELLRSESLSAVGQAMTGLIHESRNALARSQAALKLLDRKVETQPEAKRYIDEALLAQRDVQRLFEEVRNYAVPTTQTPEPCDIRELIASTWKNLKPLKKDRDVSLKEVLPEGVPTTCLIDTFSVRGAIRNLLENSLAACEDPIEITISYDLKSISGRDALELRFRDNGPGTTSDLEQIFSAFYTTKAQGTGLGLAIARRTIEKHGGSLIANQTDIEGLEFIMLIPLKK